MNETTITYGCIHQATPCQLCKENYNLFNKAEKEYKWISIKYAVPPDDRHVLIYYFMTGETYPADIAVGWRSVYKNGKVKWKAYSCFGTNLIMEEGKPSFHTVTHWQHLPEPPID